MKYLFNIFSITCILSLSACSLEELPQRDVPSEKAIENLNDAQVALYGTYAAVRDYYSNGAIALGDVMTDNCFATVGYGSHKQMQAYTFSSSEPEVASLWQNLYKVVNDANNIIAKIDGLDGSTATKNTIKGQALALRAISYMELCKWFAAPYTVNPDALGVPIKKTLQVTEKPMRAKLSEVYDSVEVDLKTAAKLLKSQKTVDTASVKYVNYWVVQSYLSRFYLYKGDYPKAIGCATEVINSGAFALASTSQEIGSMWKNDKGREIIFMLGYTETNTGGLLANDYFKLRVDTRDASGSTIDPKPTVYYVPSASFLEVYNTYGSANSGKTASSDLRYKDSVCFLNTSTVGSWKAVLCYKYPSNPSFFSKAKLLNVNMPKLIRLPELYLIRAEAYAMTGDFVNARADYNTLRKNRISGYVFEMSISGTELLAEIFNERSRELCFEGHYWFDLKRFQKGFVRTPTVGESSYVDNTAATLDVAPNSTRWLLPIPYGEVVGNKGIEPNPGY